MLAGNREGFSSVCNRNRGLTGLANHIETSILAQRLRHDDAAIALLELLHNRGHQAAGGQAGTVERVHVLDLLGLARGGSECCRGAPDNRARWKRWSIPCIRSCWAATVQYRKWSPWKPSNRPPPAWRAGSAGPGLPPARRPCRSVPAAPWSLSSGPGIAGTFQLC